MCCQRVVTAVVDYKMVFSIVLLELFQAPCKASCRDRVTTGLSMFCTPGFEQGSFVTSRVAAGASQ